MGPGSGEDGAFCGADMPPRLMKGLAGGASLEEDCSALGGGEACEGAFIDRYSRACLRCGCTMNCRRQRWSSGGPSCCFPSFPRGGGAEIVWGLL